MTYDISLLTIQLWDFRILKWHVMGWMAPPEQLPPGKLPLGQLPRCDAVFMISSASSSLRFSPLAVIFQTALKKSRLGDSNYTNEKHVFLQWNQFSLFYFHLWASFCNTIGQAHEANLWVPYSVRTPRHRVRKWVNEGKSRVTRAHAMRVR